MALFPRRIPSFFAYSSSSSDLVIVLGSDSATLAKEGRLYFVSRAILPGLCVFCLGSLRGCRLCMCSQGEDIGKEVVIACDVKDRLNGMRAPLKALHIHSGRCRSVSTDSSMKEYTPDIVMSNSDNSRWQPCRRCRTSRVKC